MGRSFLLYGGSKIRVGDQPANPRNKNITWFSHSKELWGYVDWSAAQSFISSRSHGTTAEALVIENALNKIDYYTQQGHTTVTAQDSVKNAITQDCVDELQKMFIQGRFGTGLSLLSFAGPAGYTQSGFDFEDAISELIQRASQNYQGDRRALVTGGKYVYTGGSYLQTVGYYGGKQNEQLRQALIEDAKEEIATGIQHNYEEIEIALGKGKFVTELQETTYRVPQKTDVKALLSSEMVIDTKFGTLIDTFLKAIAGKNLSLKTTTDAEATIDDTNDNTRLRSFIATFARNVARDFASICTFIFSSKRSGTVDRELDWARILYALTGVGQRVGGTNDLLSTDYLVIDRYTRGVSGSGRVNVFSVKDLALNFPTGFYDPPFRIEGANHEGKVVLKFTAAKSFLFGH